MKYHHTSAETFRRFLACHLLASSIPTALG